VGRAPARDDRIHLVCGLLPVDDGDSGVKAFVEPIQTRCALARIEPAIDHAPADQLVWMPIPKSHRSASSVRNTLRALVRPSSETHRSPRSLATYQLLPGMRHFNRTG